MSALRWVLLAGVLAAIASAVWLQMPALQRSSVAREVHRVRGYRLGAGADPFFPLQGGDTRVRLVTNALLPQGLGPVEVAYGVEVVVTVPGAEPVVHALHLRSRRTGAVPGLEDVVFDAAGNAIADSRHVDVYLDTPAAPGTRVQVRALGDFAALVRAWSWLPRDAPERTLRLLALYPELREKVGEPLGLGAWDHLPLSERAALSDHRFARLAAAGRSDVDSVSHDFYTRRAVPSQIPFVGEAVDLPRPLTWLVTGPATVKLRLAADPLGPPVQVGLARQGGAELGAWLLDPTAPAIEWTGELPEGLSTLVLTAPEGGRVQAELRAPGEAMNPPSGAPEVRVPPALQTLRTTPVGPGVVARFDADAPRDPESRSVEVEVWGFEQAAPELTVTILTTGGGAVIERITPTLVENTFDVALLPEPRGVWGPARLQVLLPGDADEVAVTATAAALVRFRVPFHRAEEVDLGDPPPTERAIGVDDGPARRTWVRALAGGAEVPVVVKGRVEALPTPPPVPADFVATSLVPAGAAVRHEVLEPLSGVVAGRVLTEIPRDRPLRVRAGPAGQAGARWSFEVEDRTLLGTSFDVSLDGEPAGTIRAALTRGTLRMPPLAGGDHLLSTTAPPGIRVFVNLPPAPGDPGVAHRSRSVWSFGREAVELVVDVGTRGPRALNVVVYDPAPGPNPALEVRAVVDGGTPRRRGSGVYTRSTPASRTWPLPAASAATNARLVDGARDAIGMPRTLLLPLGDDLLPGRHTIRVSASASVYARFFVMAPPAGVTGPEIFLAPGASDE